MGYPNGSCPQADGNTRSYDDYAVTVTKAMDMIFWLHTGPSDRFFFHLFKILSLFSLPFFLLSVHINEAFLLKWLKQS